MKDETRGLIEKALDGMFEQVTNPLEGVRWVEETIPTQSVRDLALGYTVGMMEAFCIGLLKIIEPTTLSKEESDKDTVQIRAMIKRRLTEALECIQNELNK